MLDFVDPSPSSEPASRAGPDGPSVLDRHASAPRILCVDSDVLALSSPSRILQERFAVVACDNPVHAASLLEQDGDFAVIVVANMPEMDTLELLDTVREISPTTARVVLRATSSIAPNQRAHSACRALTRPFSTERLLDAVDAAARCHALLASSPAQPVEASVPPSSWLPRGRPAPAPAATADFAATRRAPRGPLGSPAADDPASDLLLTTTASRWGLRVSGRIIELLPGVTLVGRSRTCHVTIDDPTVSRRHLCFSSDGEALAMRRVEATGRVLVNGAPVREREEYWLEPGDVVSVGSEETEICRLDDYVPSPEPMQVAHDDPGAPPPATQAASLHASCSMADRYVRLGLRREAERLLRPLLEGLLRYARSGQRPLPSDVRLAAKLALCLAELNQTGSWINYVFELLAALGEVPERELVERLMRLAPQLAGVGVASYRTCLDRLAELEAGLSPSQLEIFHSLRELESALVGAFLASVAAPLAPRPPSC